MNIEDIIIYRLAIKTTELLREDKVGLQKIQWTDGESNTDTDFSLLACKCCENAWSIIKSNIGDIYHNIEIKCNIPDINIKFNCPNNKIIKKKIELKSSKTSSIPGSTIGKLDINQSVIYCLRNNNKYDIRCAQYHSIMAENEYELFQDRSPRPRIYFKSMKKDPNYNNFIIKQKHTWVDHYAKCSINRINPHNIITHKIKKSWQDNLIKKIREMIINEFIKNTTLDEFEELKLSQEINNIELK